MCAQRLKILSQRLKGFERIIGERKLEYNRQQYLIKLQDRPYKDSIWVDKEDLVALKFDSQLLDAIYPKFDANHFYNPEYDKIEMLIREDRDLFTVKWKYLPLDQCTVQGYVPSNVLNRKYRKEEMIFPSIQDKLKIHRRFLLLDEAGSNSDINQCKSQVILNNLILKFKNHETVTLNLDYYDHIEQIFLDFCENLYKAYDIYGPFLVLAKQENVAEIVSYMEEKTDLTVCPYYGSQKSLENAIKYFHIGPFERIGFHFLIATKESFDYKPNIFEKLRFAATLSIDNQELPKCIYSRFQINCNKTKLMDSLNLYYNLSDFCINNSNQNEIEKFQTAKSLFPIPLPPINPIEPITINCPLTQTQKDCIQLIFEQNYKLYKNRSYSSLMDMIKLVFLHPYVIRDNEHSFSTKIEQSSGKISKCLEIIKENMKNHLNTLIVVPNNDFIPIFEDICFTCEITFSSNHNNSNAIIISISNENIEKLENQANAVIFFGNYFTKYKNANAKYYKLVCNDFLEEKENSKEKINLIYLASSYAKEIHFNSSIIKPILKENINQKDIKQIDKNIQSFNHNSYRHLSLIARELYKFGWSNWDKTLSDLPFDINIKQLKMVYSAIIIKTIEKYKDNHDDSIEFIKFYINEYFKPKKYIKYIPDFAPFYEKIESVLYIIQAQMILFKFDIKNILKKIKINGKVPQKFWKKENDLNLLESYYNNGFGYNDPNLPKISQDLLSSRYESILISLADYVLNSTNCFYCFLSENIKEKNSIENVQDITNDLMNKGIQINLIFIGSKNIIKQINKASTHFYRSEHFGRMMKKLKRRIVFFNKLERVLNHEDTYKILQKIGPWFSEISPDEEIMIYNFIYENGISSIPDILDDPILCEVLNGELPSQLMSIVTISQRISNLIEMIKIPTLIISKRPNDFYDNYTFSDIGSDFQSSDEEKRPKKNQKLKNKKLPIKDDRIKKELAKINETLVNQTKEDKNIESNQEDEESEHESQNSSEIIEVNENYSTYDEEDEESENENSNYSENTTNSELNMTSSDEQNQNDDILSKIENFDFDIPENVDLESEFMSEDYSEAGMTDDYAYDEEEDLSDLVEIRPPLEIEDVKETIPKISEVTFPYKIGESAYIIQLGKINQKYHNERYIFPIGFKSQRVWKSATKPQQSAIWTSEILEENDNIVFRVSSPNEPTYEGQTPTYPWISLCQDVCRVNGLPKNMMSLSGIEMFLLGHRIVSGFIEQLDGCDKCLEYIPKVILKEPNPIKYIAAPVKLRHRKRKRKKSHKKQKKITEYTK